jgi:6-phosphofructokinase 2
MVEITTLTVNPALDVSTSVWRVRPTEKLRCTEPRRDPGGGGVNVARAAARLGAKTVAIYPAGGSAGSELTTLLMREGVACHPVAAAHETRENLFVLEQETGGQFKFVMPGRALAASEQEACLAALTQADRWADYVVLSGSLAPGLEAGFFARAARAAKSAGCKVALDTSGPALLAALQERVDLVKPNLDELAEFAGHALDTEEARLRACSGLVASGMARLVALTLGADGALLVARERAWRARSPRIEPVGQVGAGDSFLAGLLVKLGQGEAQDSALRYATAAGAAALLAPGTELCRLADVERLAPHVSLETISLAAAVNG